MHSCLQLKISNQQSLIQSNHFLMKGVFCNEIIKEQEEKISYKKKLYQNVRI